MVLGWVLFRHVDDRKLKAGSLKTESRTGPQNPTHPVKQHREGWGTQFKSFGKGCATPPPDLLGTPSHRRLGQLAIPDHGLGVLAFETYSDTFGNRQPHNENFVVKLKSILSFEVES